MKSLFENSGAEFSKCGKYRYCLWRIWDETKPLAMFIGLNPSKADSDHDDNTIKRVRSISTYLGYGGFYMMNCFPYISTEPGKLNEFGNTAYNDHMLYNIAGYVKDIIFAWGNFRIVKDKGRDKELSGMFPDALALFINANGSPKHPLYCKSDIKPVKYTFNE